MQLFVLNINDFIYNSYEKNLSYLIGGVTYMESSCSKISWRRLMLIVIELNNFLVDFF